MDNGLFLNLYFVFGCFYFCLNFTNLYLLNRIFAMKVIRTVFISLALLLFFSCTNIIKIQKPVIKYVREQKCSPNRWTGIPIDTSAEYRNVAESYYVFEPVGEINTLTDEWSVSFLDEKTAILTYNDNNQQVPIIVNFTSKNKAKISSGLSIPIDGHLGGFSVSNNQVYFSRSPVGLEDTGITGNSDLYRARINRNVVSNIEPLPGNINTYFASWESHPSISPDGRVLFFSSDRIPYKGPDIFFTILLPNNTWSDPINCGDSINSECDEITPFVTKDGKYLLFASTGHDNVGGYDLFISSISDEFWENVKNYSTKGNIDFGKYFSKAKNLRPPTNTPFDEIFPSTPSDPNELLYYSSNQFDQQPGLFRRGGFDIYCRYKVTKPKVVAEKKQTTEPKLEIKEVEPKLNQQTISFDPKFKLYGYVYSQESQLPINSANVYVYQFDTITQTFPDVTKIPPLYQSQTNADGYFEFNLLKNIDYQIFAESPNFFYDSRKIRLEITDPAKEYRVDFYLPFKLTLRINFPFDVYDKPYKFVLDSNGVETNLTWEEALDMLALNIINSSKYIKKIELVGHTDDVGTLEYNFRLGQNRVNFVINELVKRGVSKDLLEGKSAGETQLLPQRPGENIEIYRKRLRRVEISKIY